MLACYSSASFAQSLVDIILQLLYWCVCIRCIFVDYEKHIINTDISYNIPLIHRRLYYWDCLYHR